MYNNTCLIFRIISCLIFYCQSGDNSYYFFQIWKSQIFTHSQVKLYFRPSNPQLMSATIQIQYSYFLNGTLNVWWDRYRYLKNINCLDFSLSFLRLLRKYFYSLAPIFVVSTKCIDQWFLNSWFQTQQATSNGKIVFRWIFIFIC